MKVKALKGFAGPKVRAARGEIIAVSAAVGKSLVATGYAEEVKPQRKQKEK